MRVDEADFLLIRRLLLERAGIQLDAGKEYLVDARLTPLALRERIPSLADLCTRLRLSPDEALRRKVLDAMVTTETSFFRDVSPFEALRETLIPALLARRRDDRRLTIWSGACSSGQEIYSVALLIKDHFAGLPGWTVRLMGSDLSRDMVARAREGVFTQLEVNRGLPAPLLARYFVKQGLDWRLSEQIRSMVEFREINLLEPWGPMPIPDVVLLRNVMIYFADDVKRAVLRRLRPLLSPEGILFLGSAETTYGLDDSWERETIHSAVCYRPARPGRKA
ncbi:MAG: protein-glutamate O-methyltransferase CheR [Planctomycetes bacterium]|nr:protein-glutamate O-methyltransferase CheR [Planctomycetota bacterium]